MESKGDLLDEVVKVITSRRKVWVDTMMKEELGLIEERKRPRDAAFTTFVAFNVVGSIPLLPFIALFALGSAGSPVEAFTYSIVFAGAAVLLIGGIKGRVVQKPLIRSALSTLLIGGIAAAVAYTVGYLLNLVI